MVTFRIGSIAICALVAVAASLASAAAGANGDDQERINEMIMLTVDKASLQADLQTLPEDVARSRVLGSFKIAFGKELGDKTKEGDNRTPEGIYFAQNHIEGAKLLTSKYGPWAIPLDFPNPVDMFHGKTGHGIWLHGAGNDERIADVNVTEGCVAFYNQDIKKLANWLEPYQGVVVISNDVNQVNRKEDVVSVQQRTNSWIAAWQNRSSDDYLSYYSDDFQLGGRGKSAYGSYKKRVFSSYKQMNVGLSQLRVITHPKYAVSIMNQDFTGDHHFSSIGRKVLFWTKGVDGAWYILREVFEKRRFSIPNFTVNDILSLGESANRHAGATRPVTTTAMKQ